MLAMQRLRSFALPLAVDECLSAHLAHCLCTSLANYHWRVRQLSKKQNTDVLMPLVVELAWDTKYITSYSVHNKAHCALF